MNKSFNIIVSAIVAALFLTLPLAASAQQRDVDPSYPSYAFYPNDQELEDILPAPENDMTAANIDPEYPTYALSPDEQTDITDTLSDASSRAEFGYDPQYAGYGTEQCTAGMAPTAPVNC